MRLALLLLSVVALMAIGAPAYSQYIYMDVNGSGTCTSADVLSASTTAVDIYLDTTHNANGSTATCVDGTSPLNMFSYDLILSYSGTGSVTFNSYTHNPALLNYGILSAFTVTGNHVGVGYSKSGGADAPNLYKLGTFNVTVSGSPVLTFESLSPDASIPSTFTGFGSQCPGTVFTGSEVLGFDFVDNCGTASGTPVESTT